MLAPVPDVLGTLEKKNQAAENKIKTIEVRGGGHSLRK